MRIDATTPIAFPFSENAEARQAINSPKAGGDTVNLSAAVAPGGEQAIAMQTVGMITHNSDNALAAHGRIDPERAMRLAGLLD